MNFYYANANSIHLQCKGTTYYNAYGTQKPMLMAFTQYAKGICISSRRTTTAFKMHQIVLRRITHWRDVRLAMGVNISLRDT